MALDSRSTGDTVNPTGPPKTGEVVATRLLARIARGELSPGDHLPPEDELMEVFGVARTTLREGLRILESQGFLAVRRGRRGGGRIIAPRMDRLARAFAVHLEMQKATMGDLNDARDLIEPQLAAHLAKVRTDDDLAALGAAIDRAAAAADADDRDAFAIAATQVHETIVERSGNATLATMSRLLHELVQQFYLRAAHRPRDKSILQRAVRSYRRLYKLVEAGDAAAAEVHWRQQMAFTIVRTDREERLDVFHQS